MLQRHWLIGTGTYTRRPVPVRMEQMLELLPLLTPLELELEPEPVHVVPDQPDGHVHE